MACHQEELEVPTIDSLLWEITEGDEWVYEVVSSYPGETKPRIRSGEILRKKDGRVFLHFERRKIVQRSREVKEGKGIWDVIKVMRGEEVEEYEYLEITSERVSFMASKREGLNPGPVMNVSIPLDLARRDMKGGDYWEYELGLDSQFVRTFRVLGADLVIVPAGTFEATKISVEGKSRNMDVKEVYWFSAEAGFVKVEKTFYTAEQVFKREVMELTQKPS